MSHLVEALGANVWRLYQFAPRNGNKIAEARHTIAAVAFHSYVEQAIQLAARATVSPSSVEQSRGCFIIGHDGALIEPTLHGHRIVGHLLRGSIDNLWSGPLDRQAIVLQNKSWLSLPRSTGTCDYVGAPAEPNATHLSMHREDFQRVRSTS